MSLRLLSARSGVTIFATTRCGMEQDDFGECSSLENVEFGVGSKLTSIKEYAFSRCTNLKSITIPVNVQSIGMARFSIVGV